MKDTGENDLLNADAIPPAKKIQKQKISIWINKDAIEFFKKKAEETGIPYQSLMNLYLTDCAERSRNLNLTWE